MFKILIFSCLIFLANASLLSQNLIPNFEGRHKNIFLELGGSNILAGVNFDMRLQKGKMDGMGIRTGVGGILNFVTFPLEFNYLQGKRKNSFEAGVGILPLYTIDNNTNISIGGFNTKPGFEIVGGYFTLGYRLQPLENGFMMKINWNPMIVRGIGLFPAWIGISFGKGFK